MSDENKIVEPFKRNPGRKTAILTGFLLELIRNLHGLSPSERDQVAKALLHWDKPAPNPNMRLGIWLARTLLGDSK